VHVTFDAEVYEHEGEGHWHFLSVPEDVSDDIEAEYGHRAGGFGSVKVEATIGGSVWQTSLFPDAKRKTYVLPVKKPARIAEGLVAGSTATVQLTVLVV
jgi:hypothetical protein